MKKQFTRSLAAFLVGCTMLGSGCAASFTPMQPERMATYQSSSIKGAPVELAYQYDALRLRGRNKKYAKKAQQHGYQVVAVRVTNNTSSELNFTRDAVLYSGDHPVTPVMSSLAANDMKQGVFIYLLYVLLNFNVGGTISTNPYTGQQTTTGGTFLPTGPLIAGGNMLGASLANKNFRNELEQYDLNNRNIHPGETVYGLVSLREPNVAPLRLELRTVAAAPQFTAPALPPATAPSPR